MVNQQTMPQHPFRIGLDLDHTILEYIRLAHGLAVENGWITPQTPVEKLQIKKGLVETAGNAETGEIRWQEIQAMIFGAHIHSAPLFPGFQDFVRDMRKQGHELYIVSHKTETSHINPSVRLREHALDTLTRRGFFKSVEAGGLGFQKEHVFFESTRAEKVARINMLKPSVFIDDLSSVLEHPDFPKTTQPILFREKGHANLPVCSNYHQVISLSLPDLHRMSNEPLKHWRLIKRGGNNVILQLEFQDGKQVVVKQYFENAADPRPRLDCEWMFLSMLHDQVPGSSPQPLLRLSNGLVMDYVQGAPPKHADFFPIMVKLDEIGQRIDRTAIGIAAHARFKLSDFREHADRRFKDLTLACASKACPAEAAHFLKEQFLPVYHSAIFRFESFCNQVALQADGYLPQPLHYPSPSDFGLHNCLEDKGGRLLFLDFEYAGWDDPVKLLCDFLRHVGNNLPVETRLHAIRRFISYRKQDPTLENRFRAVCDLVGLEWILIVLNVLISTELERKQFASHGTAGKELVLARLEKAQELLAAFRSVDDLL